MKCSVTEESEETLLFISLNVAVETSPIMEENTFEELLVMLIKTALYKFMTVKQLGKRVNKIKMKLDKTQVFEERLKLLEELAIITGVLLRRCRHDVKIVSYTMNKLDELASLVK